jgi:hypothetical protein
MVFSEEELMSDSKREAFEAITIRIITAMQTIEI